MFTPVHSITVLTFASTPIENCKEHCKDTLGFYGISSRSALASTNGFPIFI